MSTPCLCTGCQCGDERHGELTVHVFEVIGGIEVDDIGFLRFLLCKLFELNECGAESIRKRVTRNWQRATENPKTMLQKSVVKREEVRSSAGIHNERGK